MSTIVPKSPRLDLARVRAQIEMLRAVYPEIWEDDDLTAGMLEGETDLHGFLAEVAQRIAHADGMTVGIAHIMTELKERRERFERRVEMLRSLAFKALQIADVRKVELPQATFSLRTGQNKVIVTNEHELPMSCVRIRREPDKLAIRGYIAQHGSCPGAELSNAEPALHLNLK